MLNINGRIVKTESPKTKPHRITCGVSRNKSLTMTYFHRRPSTIIGAKAFHCPVRDGKEWYHLAMVVKRNCLRGCLTHQPLEFWVLLQHCIEHPTTQVILGIT